jgi:hypothetical protein
LSGKNFLKAGAVFVGSFALLRLHLSSSFRTTLRRAFGVPSVLGLLPGRVTYLIDPAGVIRHVFNNLLDGPAHRRETIDALRQLQLQVSEAYYGLQLADQLLRVRQAVVRNDALVRDQVAALKPTSTVGEATAADRALATALSGLETAEQSLEKLRLQNFQTQLKAFKGEVATVASNKNQTLEQAALTLKAKSVPVGAARRALSAAVKCEEPAAAAPAQP